MLTATLSTSAIPQRPSSTARHMPTAELRPASEISGAATRAAFEASFGATVRPTARCNPTSSPTTYPRPGRSFVAEAASAGGTSSDICGPSPRPLGVGRVSAQPVTPEGQGEADRGVRDTESASVYNRSPSCVLCVKGCCHFPYNEGFSVSRSRGVNHAARGQWTKLPEECLGVRYEQATRSDTSSTIQ